MSKKPNESDQLRTKAEMQLTRVPENGGTQRSAEELLHELQVHQVELEMQNDELRRAQVELEKSHDRYVDLYDFAPVGYLTLTRDAMIAEVNLTGAALLGIERKKLLQRRFAHLVAAEDNDCWNCFFVSALQHNKQQSCELVLKRGNGSVFYAHVDSLYMKSTSGANSVRIAFTDITAYKQEKAALIQVEKRYRTLFESIDEGFCIIEMLFDENDKPVDYRFLEVNPSFERQTGIHEATGKRIRELAPNLEAHWFEIYGKVALTGEPVRYANETKALGGRWFDVYAFPVDKQDRCRVAVLFTDVTERNLQDQVLREKNIELENARAVADKANLAKSDFLSSMSHELRSPLNAILGFAQLMESDPTSTTPSQKISLAYILQAGWHLLTLINEILDLAMIESGKVLMSQEPVALDKVMLECRNMIENQAEQRGIKLSFPQFDTPLYVSADRTRLKQILINLLSNAIKYNSKQGKTEVTCIESTPGRVRISIEDSGAGLHPEQMAQLFQPFNRLGQDAGSEEGTGIGLVLSKQLVELMGGSIGVRSTVGVGSVFWFELNLVAKPRLSMEGGETTALFQVPVLNGAQLHSLLYVEDNPANMHLVEDIISRYPDIQLLTAVNGHDGIEIARASQPSVIMMDINLPGISGLEALKILREDPTTAHIPVIAVSANALPLDIEKGLKAGLFLYITKPIKVKEFMEAVNMALEFAERNVGQRKQTVE
jgi:PAS domain S-box-containing protein